MRTKIAEATFLRPPNKNKSENDVFLLLCNGENSKKALKSALRFALGTREILGFRTASVDGLEQYVLEHGFIDELETITRYEMLLGLHASLPGIDLRFSQAKQSLNLIIDGLCT